MAKNRTSSRKAAREAKYCRICGNNKGMIHRYDINVCRRCFKDVAEKLGFKKMG